MGGRRWKEAGEMREGGGRWKEVEISFMTTKHHTLPESATNCIHFSGYSECAPATCRL